MYSGTMIELPDFGWVNIEPILATKEGRDGKFQSVTSLAQPGVTSLAQPGSTSAQYNVHLLRDPTV